MTDTLHHLHPDRTHPCYGEPAGQEVTIYLSDEEIDVLMRTAGIARNMPTYSVGSDELAGLVHAATRLGIKEFDAVARSAVTSAEHRAAVRPIREPF